MGLLNRLLRRPASVELFRRNRRAVLRFRYNQGITSFSQVRRRWPELEPLSPWVEQPGQLITLIPNDRIAEALAAVDSLAKACAGEGKLRFVVADSLRAPKEEKAPAPPVSAPPTSAPAPTVQARQNREAFFRDARALLHRTEEGGQPVPLGSECPSYAMLSPDQLLWYLCLRTALRRGEAPDTPYPYLLLYAYELVNRLGVQDARQGMDALTALWRNYRGRCPQLAGAFAGWIWDYAQTYVVDVPPAELLAALPDLPESPTNAILTALEASGAPLRLPVWLLSRLSGCDLAGSRLFQACEDRTQLETWFSDAVAAVDSAMRRQEGKGILAGRCMSRLQTRQVAAFTGAPVLKDQTYTLRLRQYHKSPRLAKWLSTVLRCIENGLRARCHVSGRLKNAEPEPFVREAIDACLAEIFDPKPAPAPRLTLNMGSVAKLREDSNAVREALLAAVAGDAPEERPPQEPEQDAPAWTEPAARDGANAWRDFLDRVDREALAALLEGPDALRSLARQRGRMPDAVLDGLNEAAADTLGDVIADEDGIYEEYAEALQALLGEG